MKSERTNGRQYALIANHFIETQNQKLKTMNLNSLKPAEGSIKHSKRIGRGAGSGKGGTSTRGNKGAKARSGYHQKVGFEGGQMPIYRRLPKFGFKNMNRVEYVGINIDTLTHLAEAKGITEFNLDVFKQNGLISSKDRIKILGRGELDKALQVTAHAFSATAKAAIEGKGGKAIVIETVNSKSEE